MSRPPRRQAPRSAGKLGRQPPIPTKPRLRLTSFLDAALLGPPPTSVDWHSRVAAWPQYGNDRYGDCVFAGMAHQVGNTSAYGDAKQVIFTDKVILDAYSAVTGFDPARPDTDQGTVVQDGMSYWRKSGLGGHKIDVFAEVAVDNVAELKTAIALFGQVGIGFDVYQAAMEQFNRGQPWDTVATQGRYLGGHYVAAVGYDETYLYCVSWGDLQPMTWRYFARYVWEAWAAVLGLDWTSDVTGLDPNGVNLYALGERFHELTGEPNPFPEPAPPAPPPPPPEPAPIPTPAPVAPSWWQWLLDWLRRRRGR